MTAPDGTAPAGLPGANGAPTRRRLNKLCEIEDWDDPEVVTLLRRILPYFLQQSAAFPKAMEHRKHWEFAQLLLGLEALGALPPDASVLAVAAGNEEVVFELTNRVRWVFATDIYGSGDFVASEARTGMLFDPDAMARCPYNRRRLVVQYMDALDLRYEDATFDAVYSLSSLEHFGGVDGVVRALREQARVTRAGGIVAFTTEAVVNGASGYDRNNLVLFTPDQLLDACGRVPGLELVEPIDFSLSDRSRAACVALDTAVADARRGHTEFPQITLDHEGRQYTSVSVFMRRV